MKNSYKLFIFALVGALTVTSCESELDIEQHSVSTLDSYYQVDSEAEEGVVACYTALRTLHTGFGGLQDLGNLLSDDVWTGGGNHYDGIYYRLNDYTYDAAYDFIGSNFSNLYTLVNRSNVVLENVVGESDVKNRAIAEAKVFRAYAYFYLTTFWGTPPLVDHILPESEYMQANSSTSELWSFIESDLTEAINSGDLTEKSSIDDTTYRITKQFAQALLGKAYIFQNKYAEAASILDEVVDSNLYGLQADLSNMGTPLGSMSRESIFEVHTLNDRSQNATNNNFRWTFMGLRGEKYSYTSDSPFATSTFGFVNPTKDLYDAFVSVEGVDGYRLNNTIVTRDQMINDYGTSNIMEITDNEGYWNFKYRVLASHWAGYFYSNNTRVMKYNEVLLLAAEAHLQNTNPEKATEYINMIRARALAPIITGTVTMEQIKTESRLELCFEGQRFENLVRWGDAASVLAENGHRNPALQVDGTVIWTSYNEPDESGFKSGKHELLPFPDSERSVNPNIDQNPHW